LNYDIKTESDPISGCVITVTMPLDDTDEKALYTMQADLPGFIMPFQFVYADDRLILKYSAAKYSKLKYHYSRKQVSDYSELWLKLLSPLIDCEDWFMSPDGFVIDTDYIYYDHNTGDVAYIYVPSAANHLRFEDLVTMEKEILQGFDTDDLSLKLKIANSILNGDSPSDIIASIKSHVLNFSPESDQFLSGFLSADCSCSDQNKLSSQPHVFFPAVSEPNQQKRSEKHAFHMPALFGGRKKRQPTVTAFADSREEGVQPQTFENFVYAPPDINEFDDSTQVITSGDTAHGLRRVSDLNIQDYIPIDIDIGRSFSIGRFDANVGISQSDFEFDRTEKSVSRRHAVIERSPDGYYIIDIGSSTGTFINRSKIALNVPYKLTHGDKISFGNRGADYKWESQECEIA